MAIRKLIESNLDKDMEEMIEGKVNRELDKDEILIEVDEIIRDEVDKTFPMNIKFPRHQARKAAGTEKGVLTIVSAGKFGHRLIFPEKVISYMGSTDKAQIGLADKGIMVIEKPTS